MYAKCTVNKHENVFYISLLDVVNCSLTDDCYRYLNPEIINYVDAYCT